MNIEADFINDLQKKGIYSITNTINNKKYIGSTAKSFRTRFTQHYSLLKRGKHYCTHLQNAFNKYGESKFIFKIEQTVEDAKGIRDLEKYYITKYNSVINGYNENPNPNCSPMLNDTQQYKVSESLKRWWKKQKESLSEEDYKEFCKKRKEGYTPWNKGKKMTSQQTKGMKKPKIHGVSKQMKDVHIRNATRFKDKSPYYVVYDKNGSWLNTFWCLSDLITYSKSPYNKLPIIKRKKTTTVYLDLCKVVNAATGNKPYKGLFFKRVPKDRKLPCANGLNSWKAEKPIMSQTMGTPIEGAETTGEVESS